MIEEENKIIDEKTTEEILEKKYDSEEELNDAAKKLENRDFEKLYHIGEVDKSGIEFNSDADTSINSAALANQEIEADEASLMDTIGQNPIKLFFLRTFIKTKNHISRIPMFLTVITMMILTIPIHSHVNALVILKNDKYNAFYFFVNVILSILSILAYINVNSKKSTKKKKIFSFSIYAIFMIVSFVIDFLYLRDMRIELSLYNSINKISETNTNYLATSKTWTYVHIIFLAITLVLASLVPLLQPLFKKIKINRKKSNKKEVETSDEKTVNSEVNIENTVDIASSLNESELKEENKL